VAIEKLIAERDELRQHLENLAPGAPDAHACLRRIYNDPKAKEAERGKAAASAIGYEKPKPAATVNTTFKLFDFLEAHRLKEQAARVIEHQPQQQPKEPLDLNGPIPETVLGGEGSDPAA
jgi:hypothetical protein